MRVINVNWALFLVVNVFFFAVGHAEDVDGGDGEEQTLREQLTEREDENRNPNPLRLEVLGAPLLLNGQYEMAVDAIGKGSIYTPSLVPPAMDDEEDEGDEEEDDDVSEEPLRNLHGQTLFEQEVELEAFYPLSPAFSLFSQIRLVHEEDLESKTEEGVSDIYLERGEAWLYSEEPLGIPLIFELGRLDFEDDRLWWWDEDLDGVRINYEADTYDVAIAYAREIAPARSDQNYIEPEHEDVNRIIGEVSWDWFENHALEFYGLHQDDQSRTEKAETMIDRHREDDTDGRLTWYGVRAAGAFEFGRGGVMGYWADAAAVEGTETLIDTEDAPDGRRVEVVDVQKQDVDGWGFDVGITCLLPWVGQPRWTVGFAQGSGDAHAEDGRDRSFHQTGLHNNEPGFGGVQRFQGYGELLDPELSNIAVLTVGLGCTILESSSVDFVFHDYRLVEPADALRDARMDIELTGVDRAVGQEFDVIVGLEEWERFEIEFSAAAFHAGDAFGRSEGDWVYAGYVSARYAF